MKIITTLLAFGLFMPLVMACEKQHISGEIKSFEYRESTMRASPSKLYRVERNEEGILLLKYTTYGPILKVIKAPEDILKVIDGFVQENKMWNMKSSYVNTHVLDGTMWNLNIKYEEGSIYSDGSNKWPSGKLRAGMDAIEACLRSIIDNVKEEDIIGYEPTRNY